MFATCHGTVRRNAMGAFTNIPTAGKIAMKFGAGDEGEEEDSTDRLIGVSLLTEEDDVLLATRNGKAIRFKSTDVREFQSRSSTGVRGIRLLGDDQVISMSILRRVGTSQEEREAYLRAPKWRDNDAAEGISGDRYAEIAEREQFLLTVTVNGYGKRSSTYEYRRTNRGGQGITNIVTSERNGGVVASFPVKPGEQLMLVTDQGKMIRTTVGDIRIAGRNTQGVTILRDRRRRAAWSASPGSTRATRRRSSSTAARKSPRPRMRSSARTSSTARSTPSRGELGDE